MLNLQLHLQILFILVLFLDFGTFLPSSFFFFFSLLLSEGAQMAQSRYLFALSCFRLDFLNEAEAALSPPNEPSAEVGD